VVGCDGANSFVREHIGTGVTDLGFHHDWLICDVVTPPGREFKPNNLQICDPARPTTLVSAGPGHRRWEFMRVPGETVDELNDAATAWKLLAEYDIHPDNATMERHAVYTFEARYADQWRSGRLLIAGDAAHLMPPFAAQGMSSGFRDAANLAWKLHFVMSGLAGAAVLDTYTVERRVHVQHAIEMSVSLGQVICETDPQKVEDRDALMLAMRSRMPDQPQPSAVKPITGGLLHGATGELTPQAQVSHNGRTGYFDEIVGLGFVVLATEPVASEFLDRIGAHVVVVDEQFDITGTYRTFLAEHGATAAIIRPDYYLFGTASGQEQFAALAADLESQLT
jgi:flavoprotein hydroxylase